MHGNRAVLLTLSGLVILAGCSGSPRPDPSAAAYDEDRGGLEGRIHDDELRPILGARVLIVGGASVVTDGEGVFVFSHLAPGAYLLRSWAPGFRYDTRTVEVTPSQAASVRIQLEPVPSASPYHATRTESGKAMCGISVWQPVPVEPLGGREIPIGACGPIDADAMVSAWELGPLDEIQGFWLETHWTSTQAAGGGMSVYWPIRLIDGNHRANLAVVRGASPLLVRIGPPELDTFLNATQTERKDCSSGECRIEAFHYAYANTLGRQYPVDFAVQFQQPYQDYFTAFYRHPPPEVFSAHSGAGYADQEQRQ